MHNVSLIVLFMACSAAICCAQQASVQILPSIVSKEKTMQFCAGKKHFKWVYRPEVKSLQQQRILNISESIVKVKNKFCSVADELRYSGSNTSIEKVLVEYADGTIDHSIKSSLALNNKVINKITVNAKYADKSWQLHWSNISLTGGAETLQLYVENHQPQVLSKSIMHGEFFTVNAVTDAKFRFPPTLVLSVSDSKATINQLNLIPQLSKPGRYVYRTRRFKLDLLANKGSFSSIGKYLRVAFYGKKISLPIVNAKIDLRVIYADKGINKKRVSVDLLTAKEYFYVQALIPRELVEKKKLYGDSIKVKLQTKGKGSFSDLILTSKKNKFGRIIYQNLKKISLNRGSYRMPIKGMKPLAINDYDQLDIIFEDSNYAKVSIPVFKSNTQLATTILKQRFELVRRFLVNSLQNKFISKKSRLSLQRKLDLVNNGLKIIKYSSAQATKGQSNDWVKLVIAMEYDRLIKQNSLHWNSLANPIQQSKFSVLVYSEQEAQAIQTGIINGKKKTSRMLGDMFKVVIEGFYTLAITKVAKNQQNIAILSKNALGNKVDLTEKILAGVESVSKKILVGSHVISYSKRRDERKRQSNKGYYAYTNKQLNNISINSIVRAKHWVKEFYGADLNTNAKVQLNIDGKKSLLREYDVGSSVRKTLYEVKIGRVEFDNRIKKEFYADVEILKKNMNIKTIEWHFFVSSNAYYKLYHRDRHGVNLPLGSFGPEDNLLLALKKAQAELQPLGKKFKFVFHKNLMFLN